MGEKEGSKVMTIYIVACFLLAMVALVGYKFANQEREELSNEYVDLAGKYADMSAAYAPNINDYYRKVKNGEIEEVDKEVRDNTHVKLREIANKLGIKEGTGADNHLDMGFPKKKLVNKMYTEYTLEVKLNQVTQTEWAVFLSQAQDATKKYAHVASIKADRVERRYGRLDIAQSGKTDRALWNVVLTFVWFGPKEESAKS
ncbi:MAG: hypothetical protein H6841_08560 [Planctomycetes bacterium]|nr:hypothetical protein [Planctomycetota bacterium]MCB9934811.1 hypothetical protein [Planctomycetota bacterium]